MISDHNKSTRSGEIDILRFCFAMIIVCYHFSVYFDLGLYRNGGVAVEFFFYLTGAFMILKNQNRRFENTYKEVYYFIGNKIRSFYPYYIGAIIMQMLVYILLNEISVGSVFNRFVRGIPNLLLIQIFGIEFSGCADIGGSWFLSAMIVASAILFCIYTSRGQNAVLILFPLLGLFFDGIEINQGLIDFSWGGGTKRMFSD